MKKRNTQKGFTIIELVVVILLLGILTATALPRFMDVTDDAHAAVVSAVVGGLGTGVGVFKGQWFADNQARTITAFGSLRANDSGYPVGKKSGTGTSTLSTVGTSAYCRDVFQNLLQQGGQPTIGTEAEQTTAITGLGAAQTLPTGYDFVAYLDKTSATTMKTCYYIYTGQYTNITQYAIPVIKYDSAAGSVTTITSL